MSQAVESLELSVVMPCLNEAETLGPCVVQALDTLRKHGIRGEVVIADNGSTDGSIEIATQAGARVVPVEQRGYGAALIGGIVAARGQYVIMALLWSLRSAGARAPDRRFLSTGTWTGPGGY